MPDAAMTFDASAAKAKLSAFMRKRKFSKSQWEKRGLLPSSSVLSARLEALFNDLAVRLITVVREPDALAAAGGLLGQALEEFDRDEYDTEEAEFVCTLFESLANVFGLRFGLHLNSWLYGEGIGEALADEAERERNPEATQTLSQPCTKCAAALETVIAGSHPGNDSESWLSIECDGCGELNFLILPPGFGSMRMNGYKMVTQYWRSQFSRDSAELAFRQTHATKWAKKKAAVKSGPRKPSQR
jgi:hypothetical protein